MAERGGQNDWALRGFEAAALELEFAPGVLCNLIGKPRQSAG
jgi:hypothetical protein